MKGQQFIDTSMNFTNRLLLTIGSWDNATEKNFNNYSAQGLLELKVAHALWKCFSPFLILLGTFGNVLSIVILCRKAMWKLAPSPYFVVLSVADITVLYSGLLTQWILYLKGIDILLTSVTLCKLQTNIFYTAKDFSVWIIVAVSVERFICICFPLKAERICSRRRAKIVMVLLLLLLFLINCHFLFDLGSDYDEATGEVISNCGVRTNDYDTFTVNIWPWIDLLVFSIIPFCMILICNICLMTKICQSWRRKKLFPNGGNKATRAKPSSMVPQLVCLNTVFLFTTAPICIYILVNPLWGASIRTDELARSKLWWAIVNQIGYLNNSVNFILYCVIGPRFRQELKVMFQRRSTGFPARILSPTQPGLAKPPVSKPPVTEQPPTEQASAPDIAVLPVPAPQDWNAQPMAENA